MERSRFDAMGDRQKRFEDARAGQRLMPGLPMLARMDGRAFHTFTRGLGRPFDVRLREAMAETAKYLVDTFHASIGYTQSDEISIVFPSLDCEKSGLFDLREQKLVSVFAAAATWKFSEMVHRLLPEKIGKPALFDARVWNVPNLELAAEHFVWREADATRNSLTMACHAHYSHKEMHGVGYAGKHEKLHALGINWNDYPASFKRGVYVRRETVMKTFTPAELARIPESRRPAGPVARTQVAVVDMPPIHTLANLHAVLFDGAAPQIGATELPLPELQTA